MNMQNMQISSSHCVKITYFVVFVFSTLTYVCDHAIAYNVTPVITFDQPLWWKALMIIESEPNDSHLKSIVLRLGGLHTEMSFLGCIGYLMAASGLEVLDVIYAGNAVKHMLTGKAISRAVRGHLLVSAALNTMLVANAYNLPLPVNPLKKPVEETTTSDPDEWETIQEEMQQQGNDEVIPEEEQHRNRDLFEAGELLDHLMKDPSVVDNVLSSEALKNIAKKIEEERKYMGNQRTAQLWLQYLNMVDIQTVHDMLPYFAASGHNSYAKSAYLYLQMMSKLDTTHPAVHRSFMNGLHVVRRSDRYWAGLSTDLVIEQVLMRSIKTSGGLTRGRGMSEIQRLTWVLGMPACAEVNCAMQELTDVKYITSEQHKDSSHSRQDRDTHDVYKLLDAFNDWDPFASEPSLRNIVSGITGHEKVNCDKARSIGQAILESMVGKSVTDFSFKRKNQAVTLGSKTAVEVNGESVQVDPQLLFQRLSVLAKSQEDPSSLFKYELCTHPPALFDNGGLPREADKPVLADAIWEQTKTEQASTAGNVHFVLDGGALLQRLPWKNGQTFDSICNSYATYVHTKFEKATIVFDGYKDGPQIKDATHLRRTSSSARNVGPNVHFTGQTFLKIQKSQFLANKANKQRFIIMLGNSLEKVGCTIIYARADADVLIVRTAVESAKQVDTVVIGEDTDLLILLCYHGDVTAMGLFFRPETKKHREWDIKKTKVMLGEELCSRLLFVHSLAGCDTTSRPYGIGKANTLKLAPKNAAFQKYADTFNKTAMTKEEIIETGEKALVCLYSGANQCIDDLRYVRFCSKVVKSAKYVEAQTLPPTSAATKYHSMRVYFQIQEWREASEGLNPEDWGWKVRNGMLLPVQTDLPPGPESLIKIFRCNCKKGCNTRRCTCKSNGMDCTWMCGECKGVSCTNSPRVELENAANE